MPEEFTETEKYNAEVLHNFQKEDVKDLTVEKVVNEYRNKLLSVDPNINAYIEELFKQTIDRFQEIKSRDPGWDCIFFDYAGIGDAVHALLVIKHVLKANVFKKPCWITSPLISTLFKDDNKIHVESGITLKYRFSCDQRTIILVNFINCMARVIFNGKIVIDISNSITFPKPYPKNKISRCGDNWVNSVGLERNWAIQHSLIHNGQLEQLSFNVKNPYVVMEIGSLSFGKGNPDRYQKISDKLKEIGINSVLIGGTDDPIVPGSIDARGLSVYDTFTLIKNSIGFMGRNSGNQCLSAFCQHVPVFQLIDTPMDFKTIGYITNFCLIKDNENAENIIFNYYSKK